MTTLVLADFLRDESTPRGFTPADHPLRNIKPDPWMLANARATVDNIARIIAATTPDPANAKDARP